MIPELFNHAISQSERFLKPTHFSSRLEERQQSLAEKSIVFKIRIKLCSPVFPRTQQPSILTKVCENELRVSSSSVRVVRTFQDHAGFGKAREHQTVPC